MNFNGKFLTNAIVVAILFVTSFCMDAFAGSPQGLKHLTSFEGGKLYKAGPIDVVELHGNFRQMGRQYGYLLSHKLKRLYEVGFTQHLVGKKGGTYKQVLEAGEISYAGNPQYVKEIFLGMAETSGLTLEQHKIINVIMLGYIMSAGCSGIGVWGDYTTDGKLIFARNWDLPVKEVIDLDPYFNIVVYNPEGTSNSVADFSYIGTVFFQTSINKSGIFLELQNGQMCDPKIYSRYTNQQLLSLLFDYCSLKEVRGGLESIRPSTGVIMNVADGQTAYTYEMATFDTKCRQDDKTGFLANSNHFLDPSWQNMPTFEAGATFSFTVDRRCNLVEYARQHKGKFTPKEMMKLYDTTIPNGGPTFPDTGNIRTIYQVVVMPGERICWLQLRGFSKWQEIDLKPLFGLKNP
ncbi:MAG: C45 family peptidase [Candidatus Ozemobacteraceae bacterium]